MKHILVTGGAVRNKNGTFKRTRKKWKFSRWNDGYLRIKTNKYMSFWVYRPDYPKATKYKTIYGYARRSHVVWWLKTGEVVPDGYILHHKDEDSLNDEFKNLKLLKNSKHSSLHNEKRKSKIKCICEACNKKFYLPQWRINQGRGKYCSQLCFQNKSKFYLIVKFN